MYLGPKLNNTAGQKVLLEVLDGLTQAPNTAMREKHLLEHSFYYRRMANRLSRGSLDGRIQPSTAASKHAV